VLNFSVKRGALVVVVAVLSYLMLTPTYASAQDYEAGEKAYSQGDYTSAFNEWQPLASQGDVLAQEKLGFMYQRGLGVPQDYSEAVRWYRLAADQGEASAQVKLGFMYEGGRGVPQDDAEAVRWYRLAAEQGNARAQNNLGVMYDKGRGVPQDDAEAVRWFRLAAEQGNKTAQKNLQSSLRSGPVDIANGILQSQGYTLRVAWCSFKGDPRMEGNLCGNDSVNVMFGALYIRGLTCVTDAQSGALLGAFNFLDSMSVPEQYIALCQGYIQ
jgi:TPR repeat protein